MTPIMNFLNNDDGATTVDWTVLAAAVVGIGIAATASVQLGTSNMGDDIDASLSGVTVAALGELGSAFITGWEGLAGYIHLQVSDSMLSGWNTLIPSFTDDELIGHYLRIGQGAQDYMASGNTTSAGLWLDAVYEVRREMLARGMEIPQDDYNFANLYDQLRAIA